VSSTRSESGDSAVAAPLARIALAVLALAAIGALLIAQHLKHEQPLVNTNEIWHPSSGAFDPRNAPASFSFTSFYRDELTVAIVSKQTGRVVAVIARDYPLATYRTETFSWPGTTLKGNLAPRGTYIVQVHFDHLDRTTQLPQVAFHVSYGTR
jgi:hypothetical protein